MDKQSANLGERLVPTDIALNVRGYSKMPSSHFYRLQFAVTLPNDEKAKLRSRSDSASAAQPPRAAGRYVVLPRILDKGRAEIAGTAGEFKYNNLATTIGSASLESPRKL